MGRKCIYPWDRWFRHNRFRLVRGVHYHCQPHSMSVMVRNAASARGVRVSVLIAEGTLIVSQH